MDNEKKITIVVNEKEIRFNVDLQDYNAFINAMSGDDKIAPSYNFCTNSVVTDDEEILLLELKKWGAPLKIAGAIIQEVTGKVEVSAKKQKPAKTA